MKKECIGCVFWKKAYATGGTEGSLHMCHHLLETGKRRVEKDGKCISRTTERMKKKQEKVPNIVSKAPVKKRNPCKKKVKAVEDGLVFESMTAAEKYYGLAHGRIHQVTNDPNKTARGNHFITV